MSGKKRGPAPKGLPRRKPIQVLVYDEELKILDEAAQAAGFDRSSWMRDICLNAAKGGLKLTIEKIIKIEPVQ